tara:strand:+ start:16249 stop:18375 length:2127 start_codon:yes stop_codon:yes gene_type:complete
VIPTGLGKTGIAMMLTDFRLNQYPDKKILMLAPTKPLVEQHYKTFKQHVNEQNITMFTGFVKPDKRQELWQDAKIIISTPQGLENDIINNKINLKEVSLLIIDEAHRATGNYSYVWLAKQYDKLARFPRILALTASPGSKLEKIKEVCDNLLIEEVEIRTDEDPDVKQYVQKVDIKWVTVQLPEEFKTIKKFLENCLKDKLTEVKNNGYIDSSQISNLSRRDLLKLQGILQGQVRTERTMELFQSISLLAQAMKIHHALELIESQGINALYLYMNDLMSKAKTTKVKATKNLVRDINFRSTLIKTTKLYEKGIEHPKLNELMKILKQQIEKDKKTKIIVFNQYRDCAVKIVKELDELNIKSKLFVGQAKKRNSGLTQKEQIQILDSFRRNEFNVLVSSSVGEEGLDIPKVDQVIFYEPVPSAIRSIQRRGRTARHKEGEIIVLVTEGTRDVAYRWSAFHKEKKMFRSLKELRNKFKLQRRETTLNKYIPKKETEEIKIFVDYREKGSGVIKELIDNDVNISLDKLNIGDFILSSRVCVEYKKSDDFVNSIVDGRLLLQLKELKRNFEIPIIIIEGDQDIYSVRNINPNAIRGMLATISISYGIPILYTKNYKDTAALLKMIAKREQNQTKKEFSLHGDKKPMTIKEQQEYLISALPGIGATLAKPLLTKFKTIKNIINAPEDELKKVELIGKKKAKKIKDVVDKEYQD